MEREERIRAFLETATAGLADDRELQLDVQAELRAHLEDREVELTAAGLDPEASLDGALQRLGAAPDLAAEMTAGNHRRLKRQARLRLLLRALVIPAALVTAFAFSPLRDLRTTMVVINRFGERGAPRPQVWRGHRFTDTEKLILNGDLDRQTETQQQRAIWEAFPENVVYLNNYLTHAFVGLQKGDLAGFRRDLAAARELDPDNARYHYLLAAVLLRQAAEIKFIPTGETDNGRKTSDCEWTVKDQARLEEGMAELRRGLARPALRRYARKMLAERLAILGPPRSVLAQVRGIFLGASTILPDLASYRPLIRAAFCYGRDLAMAGRPDEAELFLDAWQTLAVQINSESSFLIDVLFLNALSIIAEDRVADLYRDLGQLDKAARTTANARRLAAPVRDWKEAKEAWQQTGEHGLAQALQQRASVLAQTLFPALGESPPEEDFRAGRLLEYVMLEQAAAAGFSLLLFATLCGAFFVMLRWRWHGGAATAVLLLPDARTPLRVLILGIVLPLLGFWIYSRWLPIGARDYAVSYVWPKTIAEFSLLAVCVLGLMPVMAADAIRKRCAQLGIETPPCRCRGFVRAAIAAAAFVLAAGCLVPVSWLQAPSGWASLLYPAATGVFAVMLVGAALFAFVRGLTALPRYGAYYGTLGRSLVPFLALAVVLVGLLTGPYLSRRETFLVQNDSLISRGPDYRGFSQLETQLAERLRRETAAAAAALEPLNLD